MVVLQLEIVFKLAWNNFITRYRRSYMGLLWSLIYPLTSVFVLWFVFTQAFKAQPNHGDYPFIAWLLAGTAIWNFFAEALTNGTYAVTGNAYMIKKRVFNLELLPCIQVITAMFSHLLFLLLVFILYLIYGIQPLMHWLQLPYYLGCALFLSIGLVFITSSVSVFIPDLNDSVSVFIQLFFWVTPVFWSLSMLPGKLDFIVWLNPVAYLVQGYRDALLGQGWVWSHPLETLVFWIWCIGLCSCGFGVFNRLKPHFADVL